MKRTIIILLSALVALSLIWFFRYPNLLVWLEGFSFFTTLPDYTFLNMDIQGASLRYVASWLLQFYRFPLAGAVIQALIPVLSAVCILVAVRSIFKEIEGLAWLAFLPLPWIVFSQTGGDLTLVRSLAYLAVVAAVSVVAMMVMLVPGLKKIVLPELFRNRILNYGLVAVSLVVSLFFVWNSPVNRRYEQVAEVEHLAENQEWDRILETVSVQEAVVDEYMRKYVLLALSETGNLADYAFAYGLSGSEDFLFKDAKEPLKQTFNMLFYKSACMHNSTIYFAYQQATLSVLGLTFDSVRALADAYIALGDPVLGEKYVDIMEHTSCHGRWVKERRNMIAGLSENICDAERSEFEKELWGDFIPDMIRMSRKYPDIHKYSDYLMCGLLADRRAYEFYDIFKAAADSRFASDARIPRIYQEALLMIVGHQPEEISRYSLNEDVLKSYSDFMTLVSQGRGMYAKKKYAGTYWSYIYK